MIVGGGSPSFAWRELESTAHIVNITPSYLVGFAPFQVGTGVHDVKRLYFVVLGIVVPSGKVILREEPRLPSGATVTALRNAVYFNDYQQARPILVLAAWSAVLFVGMIVASRRSSAT